ncbi:MAG TPA: nuclear transport factor 2 family protein [Gammaproteobacteria bacterium]|nr:nuclear transport factor 2 family protein [Gammaproteobacteria bacterium]
MRKSIYMLLCALLLATSACASGPGQPLRDEAVIRQTLADWLKAFNSGDYAKAAEVWAPDMRGWGDGGENSYQQEMASARQRPKVANPQVHYALRIDEVMVEGDMAVVHDTWTEISPTGKARTFPSFEVWRRQPDRTWKISRWLDGAATPDSSVK